MGDEVGQHFVDQLVVADLYAHGAEPDFFGSIADAQHRNALTCDVAILTQQGQVMLPAMVLTHHMQACWAAVAGIELGGETKPQFQITYSLIP